MTNDQKENLTTRVRNLYDWAARRSVSTELNYIERRAYAKMADRARELVNWLEKEFLPEIEQQC